MKGKFKIVKRDEKYFLILDNKKHPLPMVELSKERYEVLKEFWKLTE